MASSNLYSATEQEAALDLHESVRRDTTMKITNKMHYTD